MSTFVDSSVWFAAAVARDRNNELAKSILASLDRWTLTGHVLAETWQMLSATFGREVAETFWGACGSPAPSSSRSRPAIWKRLRGSRPLIRTKSFPSSIAPASQ